MTNRLAIIRQFDAGSMVAASILLLMACLGPLYFGGVLPRERIALDLAAFTALAVVVAGRTSLSGLYVAARPALAVAAVGCFGILQSLSWPQGLTALVAPWIADTWSATAALTGETSGFTPLSLAPVVSRETGVHWLAVAACLAAAGAVGRERRLRRLLAAGVLAVAIFEIVYGSDNWFAQRGTIWGLEVGGDPTRVRGTFVNPDHLAFYLTIATAGSFALLWWSIRRVLRRGVAERQLLLVMLPSLAFLMLFVGLAFTGSRAGLAAIVLALLIQTLMLAIHYRRWQVGLVSTGALLLGLSGIALFGLQKGLGRWMETSAYEVTWNARLVVYNASWKLWWLCPWTGTGLGSFRQAFPEVQPSNLDKAWHHAHNDILELLVTTGIVGLPLAAWGVVAICRRLWAVFQHGRRSEERAAGLCALGALAGALAHSTVDFGLTIPANAFTLAIVCGLACGAATGGERLSRSAPQKPRPQAKPDPETLPRRPPSAAPADEVSARPRASARSSPPSPPE